MSWFDAGALANIAKSALKEAQKTIDKALDIKEDAESIPPVNTPVDTNSDDFFGTWGITQSGNVTGSKEQAIDEATKQSKMTTSIWGSFTGKCTGSKKNRCTLLKLHFKTLYRKHNYEYFKTIKGT